MSETSSTSAKVAGRILDEAVGGSVLVNGISKAFGYMVEPAKMLTRAGKDIFGPWKKLTIVPDAVEDAGERFEMAARVAAASSNSGDAEISQRIRVAGRRFEFWSYISMAMLGMLILTFGSPGAANFILGHHLHIMGQLMILLIATSFIAQAVKVSFWSFQLRSKALVPFAAWMSSPSDWVPPDASMPRHVVRFLPWFIVGGLLAVPHHAVAQAVTSGSESAQSILNSLLGQLPSTDISLQWMNRLFPSAMSASGVSYSNDAIAQMMQAMNTVLIGMASVMLTYHTISGLVATATDGTVLGEKWHSTWAPIRIVSGVASVFPVAGYCAAQLLVIQIILASYGLANVAWNAYLASATGSATGSENYVVAPVMDTQTQLFDAALASQTCLDLAKWINRPAGTSQELTIQALQASQSAQYGLAGVNMFNDPGQGVTNDDGSVTFSWGTVCGAVTFPVPPSNAVSDDGALGAMQSGITEPPVTPMMQLGVSFPSYSSNTTSDAAVNAFFTARQQGFATFLANNLASTNTNNVAEDIAQANVPSISNNATSSSITTDLGTAQAGFQTYMQTVTGAAATMGTGINGAALNTIKQEGSALGWASAGSIQSQLVTLNEVVASAAGSTAEITMPSFGDIGSGNSSQQLAASYNAALSTIATAMNGDPALSPASQPGTTVGSGSTPTVVSGDVFIKAMKAGGDPIRSIGEAMGGSHVIFALLTSGPGNLSALNPMGDLITEGEWIKNTGYLIEGSYLFLNGGAYAAVDAADNVSKETLIGPWIGTVPGAIASGLKGMLAAMTGLITSMSEMMIITGLMMEVVLPMMQYMMWMAAIAGLMVFAVEAVVGASFWAFSHVRADGQELVNQQQSYGYSILMNAIFRPLLTLVGLVSSSVIMAVMAQFVDETFALAFSNSGVGGLYDPFAIVALFMLLFYIHYQIAVRALRTITMLPDAILKWIGSGVSASSYGELMGEEHGNNYMGVFKNSTTGKIGRSMAFGREQMKAKGGGGGNTENPPEKEEDSSPE
jgi:conjugal transfer/type IV secretion protein DotA/TraY